MEPRPRRCHIVLRGGPRRLFHRHMGRRAGQIISAVAYDNAFGFIGLYIVRPEWRGKGFGKRLWHAALDYLGVRTVGLDSVLAQQANYCRAGFAPAHRNVRYEGVISDMSADQPGSSMRAPCRSNDCSITTRGISAPAVAPSWMHGSQRPARAFFRGLRWRGLARLRHDLALQRRLQDRPVVRRRSVGSAQAVSRTRGRSWWHTHRARYAREQSRRHRAGGRA